MLLSTQYVLLEDKYLLLLLFLLNHTYFAKLIIALANIMFSGFFCVNPMFFRDGFLIIMNASLPSEYYT